ncbi:P2X purinoceptor 4-like [Ischnura elegans]|uniref:P2X purinoceptor 4-like n=1 Tax=Ischnura elegans TaxID=197161 RepID=UPI001ED8681B|nr:P2X purinoceptor 4-like [Ischnura elegans]
MSCFRCIPNLLSPIFEYETAKVVVIKSKKVSITYRFIQLLVLCYIIGYVLVYEKGYQSFGNVESATMTKVKGVTVTNYSSSDFNFPDSSTAALYNRVWDVAEYVVPHSENDAFFIITNVVITPNQTQSTCDEDPTILGALCDGNNPCPVGEILLFGNGKTTGKCVPSTQKPGVSVCEVEAWCPVEKDLLPLKGNRVLINGAENYTVLIKNSIAFPSFGPKYRRNNILDTTNSSYLQSCRFDAETDPFCPVFRIGDIISDAGENFEDMAYKGGIMSITIKWNCDLDWSFMKYCKPEYSFYRLDDKNSRLSPGLNFRFPVYEGYEKRTLLKAHGIRFVIQTIGKGGKFDLIPTLLNVGAGSGLMVLAPFVCDYIALRFTKSRERYKTSKVEYVEGDDAFRVNREEYQPILS